MRCFIGVPLPDLVSDCLVEAQACFRVVDARMTVVKKENMHVSLLFLGEVDDVDSVVNKLKQVKFKTFKASLKGISFFPKKDYIRVIHSPVLTGVEEFSDLYNQIVKALGVKPDRFNPHATLARVKFVRRADALVESCSNELFDLFFKVEKFNLYSSNLTPAGPVYKIIRVFSSNP